MKPSTEPATSRIPLSEAARHVVAPVGIKATKWPRVRETCNRLGWTFDGWQNGAGKLILATRSDGSYSADTIVLSIARQVGKTYLVACIIFAYCLIFPGTKVIWTAHRKSTAGETFRQFDSMAQRPKVAPHIQQVRRGKGDEVILFKNGSTIEFGARESGFGRGRTDVDVLVFDEGQILPESTLEDMGATQNVAKNPLTFIMGTPPRPRDTGEFFTLLRREALSGESDSTLYIEMSADAECDPMDRAQWRKANPSFPHRTTERAMLRLRKKLRSDDSWRREALGIWDKSTLQTSPIDALKWDECAKDVTVPEGKPDYYALSISPERIGYIGVAFRGEAADFVDLAEAGRVDDSRKIVDWFAQRRPCTVAIDGRDPAAALVNELRASGVRVNVFSRSDATRSSMSLVEAVNESRLDHVDQPAAREAALAARKKAIAGGWEFDPDGDIEALRALANARYGLTFKRKRSATGGRTVSNGRRVSTGRTVGV